MSTMHPPASARLRSAGQRAAPKMQAMQRPWFWLAAAVALALVCIALIPVQHAPINFAQLPAEPSGAGRAFRDTAWRELAPVGWNPFKEVTQMQQGMRYMPDTDPRAMSMLDKLREVLDHAPVNAEMNGVTIRIAGYAVPLEESRAGITEFLLVPYFGACIHSPPPPSNQIIDVRLQRPLAILHSMKAVWVAGTLHAHRSQTSMGTSGYALQAASVELYVKPGRD
jgi:uncharacterized protein